MKKTTLFLLSGLMFLSQQAAAQPATQEYRHDIHYFHPEGNYTFDPRIPQPKDILGFEIGQQHADWNNVLAYMKALD